MTTLKTSQMYYEYSNYDLRCITYRVFLQGERKRQFKGITLSKYTSMAALSFYILSDIGARFTKVDKWTSYSTPPD